MASQIVVSLLVTLFACVLIVVLILWIALASSLSLRRRWLLFWLTSATAENARKCASERADYDCARRAAESAKAEAEAKQKGRAQRIEDIRKAIIDIEGKLHDKASERRRRELTQRQADGS